MSSPNQSLEKAYKTRLIIMNNQIIQTTKTLEALRLQRKNLNRSVKTTFDKLYNSLNNKSTYDKS